MSGKRVAIGLKPGTTRQADEWVARSVPVPETVEEGAPPAVLKRLTIDVSEDLHRRLKVKAAQEVTSLEEMETILSTFHFLDTTLNSTTTPSP